MEIVGNCLKLYFERTHGRVGKKEEWGNMGCFENPIVVYGYILCNVLVLSSVIFSIV